MENKFESQFAGLGLLREIDEEKSRQTEKMPQFAENRKTEKMPSFSGERQTEKMPEIGADRRTTEFDQYEDGVIKGRVLVGEHGKYTTISRLKNGGTAEIWIVTDGTGNYVAKIYNSDYHNVHINELYHKFSERFEQGNTYNGLISIKDKGLLVKRQFYILPFFSEQDFGMTDLDDAQMLSFVRNINETLHTLHSAKFYHRDIKPDNILYDVINQKPILIDYGSVTVGGNDYGYDKSITKNVFRTEGYTAPEVSTEYGLSGGERVMANEKTDYFSLGAVLAGAFKKRQLLAKNPNEKLSEREYRLFQNDIEAFHATQENKVIYPDALESNPRFFNLVQALLRYDNATRAGYDEVCRWLAGEYLEIDNTVYKKVKFEYVFHGKIYESKEDLARAMALDWDYAISEVFRKFLYQNFPQGNAYKAERDYIYDTVDSYEKNYRNIKDFESACLAEIITYLNPAMAFCWKGVIYEGKSGRTDFSLLADAFYRDVEDQTGNFDALIRTTALKTLLPSVSETDLNRFLKIGEQSKNMLKYELAEICEKGSVVNKVSKGLTKKYHEYIEYLFHELEEGAFDEALAMACSGRCSDDNILLNVLKSKIEMDKIVFLIRHYTGIELPALGSGSNKQEQIIDLVKKLGITELYERKVETVIQKSRVWNAIAKISRRIGDFDFIDYGNTSALIAQGIKSSIMEIRQMTAGNKQISVQDRLNAIGKMLKIMKRFYEFYIFDEQLAYSGLLLRPNKTNYSYIRAQNSEDNLWITGSGNFLSPSFYAMGKDGKNRKAELLDAAIKDTKAKITAFYNNAEQFVGKEKVEALAKVSRKTIITGMIISFATVFFGVMMLFSAYIFYKQGMAENPSMSGGIFMKVVEGIDVVLGGITFLCGVRKIFAASNYNKKYRECERLVKYFKIIKKAVNGLDKMEQTGKSSGLSDGVKELIPYSVLPNAVSVYFREKEVQNCEPFIVNIRLAPLIFLCLVSLPLITYSVLPASTFTVGLLSESPQSVYDTSVHHKELKSFIKILDTFYAGMSYKACGYAMEQSLLSQYNSGQLLEQDYTDHVQKLISACEGYDVKMNGARKNALSNLVASKKAYAEGANYFNQGEKKKAAGYLISVIREDSNYNQAQKIIREYVEKLYERQRDCISKENAKGLKKLLKEYKAILADNSTDNDIRIIYDVLSQDTSENALKRLIAYFIHRELELWEDIDNIAFAKIDKGVYAVKVGVKNHGISQVFSMYTYEYHVFGSTGEIKYNDTVNNLGYSGAYNANGLDENTIIAALQ